MSFRPAPVLRRRLLRLLPPPPTSCSHAGPSRYLRRHQSSSATLPQRVQSTPPHVWSLLTDSTDAIVHSLDPRQRPFASPVQPVDPLVVVLITTAHIALVDTTQWLGALIQGQLGSGGQGKRVHVLVGVVDGIPELSPRPSGDQPQALMRRPNLEVEGISVAVLDLPDAAPNLWSPKDTQTDTAAVSARQPGTLSFAVRTAASSKTFQLPLATTLFLNGRISTLTAERWQLGSTGRWNLLDEKLLPSQTLNLSYGDTASPDPEPRQYSSLLKQITSPRTIVAAFGNVVRRVAAPERNSEAVPASKELETAIQAYVENIGELTPQKPEVWALITPKGVNPGHSTDRDRQSGISDLQIQKGCRLHKVLSGGGGWGARQGLISLDPDSDYDTKAEQAQYDFDRDLGGDGEKLRDLQSIVKPGDVIVFYVNDTNGLFAEQSPGQDIPPIQPGHQTLQFGTLPTNVDTLATTPMTTEKATSHKEFTKVLNHFGMLSRHGMSYQYAENTPKRRTDADIEDAAASSSGNPDGHASKTKLDAPYSLYSLRVFNS